MKDPWRESMGVEGVSFGMFYKEDPDRSFISRIHGKTP